MKKLLLIGFTIMSAVAIAQDFSTYCSEVDFTAGKSDRFASDDKAFTKLEAVDGALVATKKDTVGDVQMNFTVPEFWLGGKPMNGSVFRFKIKVSYNAQVRIKVVSSSFGLTYDIPFAANKNIVGGADYVNYVLDVKTGSFDSAKFQQVIFVVTNSVATAGTISIKDFNYGDVACGTFEPTATTNAASSVLFAKAYPNPVTENLTIAASLKENANVKVTMVNTLGYTVYSTSATNTNSLNQIVETSTFGKGAYSLLYFVNDVMVKNELVVVK